MMITENGRSMVLELLLTILDLPQKNTKKDLMQKYW